MTDLSVAIRPGPECPSCGTSGFDDWQHTPGLKIVGSALTGRL